MSTSSVKKLSKSQSSSATRKLSSQGSSNLMLIVGIVIIIIVAAAVGAGIYFTRQKPLDITDVHLSSFSMGNPQAPGVDLFEDPMCPACGEYEQTVGAQQLVTEAKQGKVFLRYHILNILNANSVSGDYSSRAAMALYTIAHSHLSTQQRIELWTRVHTLFFSPTFQPPEGGDGPNPANYTNAELASHIAALGKQIGIPVPTDTINDINQAKYLKETNALAATNVILMQQKGIVATPSLYFHNKIYNMTSQADDKNPANIGGTAFVHFVTGK